MLISLNKKLTFLAMPKAASTSIEMALFPHCDISFYNSPKAKHIPYRRYKRYIFPYLENLGFPDIETTCLFRDPVDWLFSWYSYRSRPAIAGKPQSTAEMSFEEFALSYVAQDENSPQIGRPSNFVSSKDGVPSVDHIFRYENLLNYTKFLESRFEEKIDLDFLNVSPDRKFEISTTVKSRLEDFFKPEYEIYESARQK